MMRFAAFVLACSGLMASTPEQARIFYSKSFPGSVPPYVSIDVGRDGSAVYQESPQDENAVKFQVPAEDVKQIFEFSEKLGHFKRPLESGLKVANMGTKTFRYQNGTETNEVKFNYSQDETARLLADLFEKLTETQQYLFELERTVRFDKLGVNKTLLQIEAAWNRSRIAGAERLLPLLDRIAKNESYLHMARERAAALADTIRAPKPPKTTE